jgi:hypothetical protein
MNSPVLDKMIVGPIATVVIPHASNHITHLSGKINKIKVFQVVSAIQPVERRCGR